LAITGIKGMNDILPGEVETWQFLEATARRIFAVYGFSEIRVPVAEKTELFCRSIGETTDIVEKEMYTFTDKGGNSLTLRPEGTASVMRALIEHKLYAQDPVARLYYIGPMFRHERPQKGRYRQFHQIGAEAVGIEDPRIDVQVMAMLQHFLEAAGITGVELQINSLGCPECRPGYRQALLDFLQTRLPDLCEDCRRRSQSNPLRVLDCKVPGCKEASVNAPNIVEHICDSCGEHFTKVRQALIDLNLPFVVNPRMVRGLDYYTKTTFEVVTNRLGAQNAVAAGGRFDRLVEELGGPKLPGIGFAMGIERLVLLKGEERIQASRPPLFLAALGEEANRLSFRLMNSLQRAGLRVEADFEGKSLKAQMRRAGKLRSQHVLILGGDELKRQVALLRHMDTGGQEELPLDGLSQALLVKLAIGSP
jgi:histidyl-tRNA synthetase